MKIATIYTLYGRRAGAELFFERTVRTVAEKYPDVEWLAYCNDDAMKAMEGAPRTELVRVPWLNNQYKKAFWLEFLAWGDLKRRGADCFWIPSGCNHFPGPWAKRLPVVTTFLDFGEYHVAGKYSRARMIFRKAICIPRNLRRARNFTTISRFTTKDLHEMFGIAEGRIRTVYPGNSPHRGGAGGGDAAAEAKVLEGLGLRREGYFFTPGRTDYLGKGLDTLFAAFRRFAARHEGVELVLVGPQGEGYERMQADWARDGAAGGRMRYLGRVEEEVLGALYGGALATVLPSRFEGFGFPVLEAMGKGSPVVCSDAGSLPEVAGDAAWMFPAGDETALEAALERCAADGTAREEAVRKGRAQYGKFSWEATAEGMAAAFREAVEGGGV